MFNGNRASSEFVFERHCPQLIVGAHHSAPVLGALGAARRLAVVRVLADRPAPEGRLRPFPVERRPGATAATTAARRRLVVLRLLVGLDATSSAAHPVVLAAVGVVDDGPRVDRLLSPYRHTRLEGVGRALPALLDDGGHVRPLRRRFVDLLADAFLDLREKHRRRTRGPAESLGRGRNRRLLLLLAVTAVRSGVRLVQLVRMMMPAVRPATIRG